MKKLLFLLLFPFLTEAQILPGVAASGNNVTVSTPIPGDLVIWEAATSVDDTPTSDGDFFWHNPANVGIRASLHYDEGAYSIETVGGREYYKLHIDPDTPDAGVGLNNYRAEIERHVTTKPVGTIRMVGSGFRFPDLLDHSSEFGIAQWHTGTAPGGPYPSNSPVIYLGLAYDGQGGAALNELVVVNKVKAFETSTSGRTNTGVVITAGTEYFIRQYLKGGTGTNGRYILQMKIGRAGIWQTLYDQQESTIWNEDDDGGSNSQVVPYWKTGIYAFGIISDAGAEAHKALNGGSYHITMYLMDKLKTADLLSSDPDYNYNPYTLLRSVDTSN